ncbi:Rrp15p domain containing protein [Rhypophila decipiens]
MGSSIKKRSHPDGSKGAGGSKGQRPTKKQRKAAAYHSSSSEGESDDENDNGASLPAGLIDSDEEDADYTAQDDSASSDPEEGGDLDSFEDDIIQQSNSSKPLKSALKSSKATIKSAKKDSTKEFKARDAPESSSSEDDDDAENSASEAEDSDVEMASDDDDPLARQDTKSKRNDPDAFATSITKMLSSKLPTSKRADPIVARSKESAAASRQVLDAALEAKARKRLREQKRLAMEKGRIRDVLMPTTTKTLNIVTGEIEETLDDGKEGEKTTAQIIATERRLKKVAQRGVVYLFNLVRAAQVKAAEAQRVERQEGIVGSKRREEKVTEMSRQGFLDLIASGGGGLKKGALEEA